MKLLLNLVLIINILLLHKGLAEAFTFNEIENSIRVLTDQLFENLRFYETDPSEEARKIALNTTDTYQQLARKRFDSVKHSRKIRSVNDFKKEVTKKSDNDANILNGFEPYRSSHSMELKDIGFFHDYERNRSGCVIISTTKIHIYSINGQDLEELCSKSEEGIQKISVAQNGNVVIIVASRSIDKHTVIYKFPLDKPECPHVIETISNSEDDVLLWKFRNSIHMILANTTANQFYLYEWQGKYFDLQKELDAKHCVNPKFDVLIDENHFSIAVACSKNKPGKTAVYSYLYHCPDIRTCQFHQPFRTYGARDVKFFKTDKDHDFLVFANYVEEQNDKKDFNIYSMIYERQNATNFVPFQGLKLNGAYYLLPIKTSLGALILLVATRYEGIKAFQYDGFSFVEADVQYSHEAFSKPIRCMHYKNFNNVPLLVIVTRDHYNEMIKWFEIKFREGKSESRYHDDLLTWCKNSITSLQSLDMEGYVRKAAEDLKEIESNEEEELGKFKDDVESYMKDLGNTEKQLHSVFRRNTTNHFKGDVHVKELILDREDNIFNSVDADFIDNIDIVPIVGNVVDVNQGLKEDVLFPFDNVTIHNKFFLKSISAPVGVDIEVQGNAILNEVSLSGKLNGIIFDKSHILLNKQDQQLNELHVNNNVTVTKLELDIGKNAHMLHTTSILTDIHNMKAKTIILGSYINNIDIPSLNKHILRKNGNQTITAKYTFDSLHVNNIDTETLSNKSIKESIILTNYGDYKIDHGVMFKNDIKANMVQVSNNLNNIKVLVTGELDVLLSNDKNIQYVSGLKEFETLEVLNPIDLRGKCPRLDNLNPNKEIDEEFVFNGNCSINGLVKVINNLQSNDVMSSNNLYSITQLESDGLKINEAHIPVHMDFVQSLNVKQVWLDRINDLEVDSFVTINDNKKEPQVVTALKKFPNDIHIIGSTEVESINSLDLEKFQKEIVQLNPNLTISQVLRGKYHFENVEASSISNVKTEFNGHLWGDVLTTNEEQSIEGTTIIENNVETNELNVDAIKCHMINGYNFTKIINDTVFDAKNLNLSSNKKFRSLSVENLNVSQVQNLYSYQKLVDFLRENLGLFKNNITINRIMFSVRFNEVSHNQLLWWFNTRNGRKIIKDSTELNEVNIGGRLQTKMINDIISVDDIINNSVKVDEDFSFNRVTVTHIDGVSSNSPVQLQGQFESLDLKDVFVDTQPINDEITFHSNVTVMGDVIFNGLISGFNLTTFCHFSKQLQLDDKKNLHIDGNIIFKKEAEINSINNSSINSIINNIWFKDEPTTLTGYMNFNNLNFKENMVIHGLLNDQKIELLEKTYLSKTQNQNVSAVLEFENYVEFQNGISSRQARIAGNLGSIGFDELMSTIFLQGVDQVFSYTPYFENCKIIKLTGDYKINDRDLVNEVMIFDRDNYVSGKKVIGDVYALKLNLPVRHGRRVHVQNVDLLHLLQAAVLKTGEHRLVGNVNFKGHTRFLDGIRTKYPIINGVKFNNDTIMLKSVPQNITGTKMFSPRVTTNQSPIVFKSMQAKAHIDGVNMTSLLEQQAYKNEDSIFKKEMKFNGSLLADNVNIEGLYNNMVNVSEFTEIVVQSFKEDDSLSRFQRLYNITMGIMASIAAQAYYLDYYEVRQIYKKIDFIFPVKFDDPDVTKLVCITKMNDTFTVDYKVWDEKKEIFITDNDWQQLTINKSLNYLTLVSYKSDQYFYYETKKSVNEYGGNISRITKTGYEPITQELTTDQDTKSVVSVVLPDENIDCFFFLFKNRSELKCENKQKASSDSHIELDLRQQFEFIYNGSTAVSVFIEGIPYIFITNKHEQGTVIIWCKHKGEKFTVQQIIHISNPTSIAVTFYKGNYYLGITSGHVELAKYHGFLEILKFNKAIQQFQFMQRIDINAPFYVEFSILPTDELVLYVLTESFAKPLVVYEYQGISGFIKKVIASTLPRIIKMKSLNIKNEHFILAMTEKNVRVIQAIFKGKKD